MAANLSRKLATNQFGLKWHDLRQILMVKKMGARTTFVVPTGRWLGILRVT